MPCLFGPLLQRRLRIGFWVSSWRMSRPWCEVRKTSRWYKCDLQVATPAWDFEIPTDRSYNFREPVDRAAFADVYMARLKEQGIEVIALADHHTAAWLADMQAAGARAGVTVFPGVEVTTGSGSDGAHLVLIGDLDKTEQDIEILLSSVCGFGSLDNPKFNPARPKEPAPSPRSIADILTALPDGWLAFAPHVLGSKGLASGETAKSTIRWKALHHDRLSAIDVGWSADDKDVQDEKTVGFNRNFRSRSRRDFPCLGRLAFISTSDAYKLEDLGSRFTWIRMSMPSLEGLRQAFLDHEARIIRDRDERLSRLADPNKADHAWIESVSLGGTLGNSAAPLGITFNPRLNVIIGGRGAGKSTVVAALRQLYGSAEDLPGSLRAETEEFAARIFNSADLRSVHHLPISGERQEALWSSDGGATTNRSGATTATSFPIRLFAQKELYERIKSDPQDPYSASRNLLALIDDAVAAEGHGSPAEFDNECSAAESLCEHAVRTRQLLQTSLAQRAELAARVAELRRQLTALDDANLTQRRDHNARLMRERAELEAQATSLEQTLRNLRQNAETLLSQPGTSSVTAEVEPGTAEAHRRTLQRIRSELQEDILAAINRAGSALKTAEIVRQEGRWAEEIRFAVIDDAECQAKLTELGVDPERYLKLRDDLAATEKVLTDLAHTQHELEERINDEAQAWAALTALRDARARRRVHLVRGIESRSATLRFELTPYRDWVGWVARIRDLLNLRSDGYIEDVRAVGRWLWSDGPIQLAQRLNIWRTALIDADHDSRRHLEQNLTGPRKNWWERLWRFDPAVRLRLGTLIADDVITMRFLKNGGQPDRDQDWQDVSYGSPGQRGAAMLSFVLHQGSEPLILDQPEDDLDTSLISQLIVTELRKSRWTRQLIVVTHNANIPVLGDAEEIIVMEANNGNLAIKQRQTLQHVGPIEIVEVRKDIQDVMEGGVAAFIMRERRYDNELSQYRRDLDTVSTRTR
jgi:energy-coupling factor transporter ATP-binding protein EcfA2